MVTHQYGKIGGGGVGFYIKECMSFKVRHDLGKIDESIRILWIELRGRNKNTPILKFGLKSLNIFLVRFIQNGMVYNLSWGLNIDLLNGTKRITTSA